MAVSIRILCVYRARQCFSSLLEPAARLLMLFLDRSRLRVDYISHDIYQQKQNEKSRYDKEPRLLVESFDFDYFHRQCLMSVPHRVCQLYDEMICAAAEVRVVYRRELRALHCCLVFIKTFEPVCHLWICK